MMNVGVPSVITAASQQKNIEKAARSNNPMEPVLTAGLYSSSNREFSLSCRTRTNLETKTLKWAFKLAERNVGQYYKELAMGWQPKKKQNDLNKNWARYLVAQDNKNRSPVAYAMFRFDMDYGHSVLYVCNVVAVAYRYVLYRRLAIWKNKKRRYELQIEPSCQRQGLGKFMMNLVELCARHWMMEKVVLTVLKNNSSAMFFFRSIGYIVDESNPDVLEKAEYEILSKIIN